jgi:single-strand DNA-binding protein
VRLIGFLGKDAELKTTKSGNEYAILSLATQASWKDKKSGDYVNRTEWHRMLYGINLFVSFGGSALHRQRRANSLAK